MEKEVLESPEKSRAFFENIAKNNVVRLPLVWTTPNKIIYVRPAFTLRDFSTSYAKNEIPTLILPPYAGHASTIADFQKRQSLIETLLQKHLTRVFCIEWHAATQDTKDYDIDNYLAELHTVVKDLGGRVNLIGLCQSGWIAALYAARYPLHVAAMVCAGTPLDTLTDCGGVRELANALPTAFYENLVAAGNGLLEGRFMLEGFKSMHPDLHMMNKYISLYEYIDDHNFQHRTKAFEHWYKNTIELPGRWYLQVVQMLFKENRFAKGDMVAQGQRLKPQMVVCPTYLLAGSADDIAPKDQVFNIANSLGTPKNKIVKTLASSGHMGLFIGTRVLREKWPKIAAWLLKQEV
ncbi:MAG: alpha/beta fold hydrolase [Bdellovibrionales bacterium]